MEPIHQTASEAWQLYRRRGQISSTLLRSHVYRAWERAHILKASPLHMKAEQLSAQATEQLLSKKMDLIQAARPYMQALSSAAGRERHAAMLGDSDAIVLDVVADEATLHGSDGFPEPGSILQEALSGSNGIGTPLVENAYAELVGAEHFIQGFHHYTCQGVPIVGPGNQVVGVLSTSVRRPEASQRLREIMIVAAQGIGAELLLRQLEAMVQQIVRHAQLSEGVMDKLRQDLVQIYTAGRMNVEVAALQLSRGSDASTLKSAGRLLEVAARAMEKFRKLSTLCLNLARSDSSPREWVHVNSVIDQIEDLLTTEARIKKVIIIHSGTADAVINTDRRLLEKSLLRVLLSGLNAAEGHILKVEVLPLMDGASYEIAVIPILGSQVPVAHAVLKLEGTGTISMENKSTSL